VSTVRRLEERFSAGQRSPVEQALTWAALGLLHCHLGRVEAARECYSQVTRHFPAHPELASAMAEALIQCQRPREALPLLQVALADDKTAAGAHMLMGSIFAKAKDVAQAQAHLQTASALAPAWTQLLELRSALHTVAGQHQEAECLRQRCSEFRQQALQLAARLQAD
jgi:predicted Zn-dependent protease